MVVMTYIEAFQGVFFDPAKRLFWGFLLLAIPFSLFALYRNGYTLRWRLLKKVFFNRGYWFNTSTKQDVIWALINLAIKVFVLVPFLVSHLFAAIGFARILQKQWGSFHSWPLGWWGTAILFTSVFFIVEDFSRFALHRAMHKVPFLWRLHRVHHSATVLTPLTLLRVHSLEMVLYYFRGLAVFSVVAGTFIYFAGSQLSTLQVLGVDAFGLLFNAFAANLRHSHIWLGFGVFESVL